MRKITWNFGSFFSGYAGKISANLPRRKTKIPPIKFCSVTLATYRNYPKIFHPHAIFGRHYGIKELTMWRITVWRIWFHTSKKFVPRILMENGYTECDARWQIFYYGHVGWKFWGKWTYRGCDKKQNPLINTNLNK
jgi:hypothetical protein